MLARSGDDEDAEELTILAAVAAEGIAKLLIAAARGGGGMEEGVAVQVWLCFQEHHFMHAISFRQSVLRFHLWPN